MIVSCGLLLHIAITRVNVALDATLMVNVLMDTIALITFAWSVSPLTTAGLRTWITLFAVSTTLVKCARLIPIALVMLLSLKLVTQNINTLIMYALKPLDAVSLIPTTKDFRCMQWLL